MRKVHYFSLLILLVSCGVVHAQARSIDKIVDNTELKDVEERKIAEYATYWSDALSETDGDALDKARKKLADPLEPSVGMSPIARSVYGDAVIDATKQYLAKGTMNDMAAVNALQVVSLLGTEQGCDVLLRHADNNTEDRDALRLWSIIGIGTTFQVGIIDTRQASSVARLVATYIAKEQDWYVISRAFETLALVKQIPDRDSQDRADLEELSFELQANSLVALLGDIQGGKNADSRVSALPIILPSLLLQFVEPGIDEVIISDAKSKILPHLLVFVESTTSVAPTFESNPVLHEVYGHALWSADKLIRYLLNTDAFDDVSVIDLWENGNVQAIQNRVSGLKELSK
jgi:hypothetical protein